MAIGRDVPVDDGGCLLVIILLRTGDRELIDVDGYRFANLVSA